MAEKVRFGVSNLHVGTYEVADDGTVSLGTPVHVAGTVSISFEADASENNFFADNVKYWTGYSDNGYTGEIENALFDDTFKTTFMNYVQLDDGGIAQIKGRQNPPVYFIFEGSGDAEHRRMIVYNVALGQINREYETTEDSIEPQTATLPFTANGDNATGIVYVSYKESDAVYSTMFTTPPVPALPAGSSS